MGNAEGMAEKDGIELRFNSLLPTWKNQGRGAEKQLNFTRFPTSPCDLLSLFYFTIR
jgi:hypothetical protein